MIAIGFLVYLTFVILLSTRTNTNGLVNFIGLPFLGFAIYFGYHFLEKVL